ncbi:hypothetical protein DL766_001598 [Monosporascus sp. MC13-8B]|nr:hypothetical protein DL763_006599 [Monosporascus cannonballus]RYP37288.1 hypothetical protein DL766_001598 [Monosporascus sp. MC13-8B]
MPERYEVRYFGAGPALLPTEVLEDAARALLNYDDTGLGLAEQSHRSERAWNILKKTKADLAAFLDIPSNYEILFMQGGGSGQFSCVVYHLVGAWVQRKKDELIEALFGGKNEEEIDQDELVAELKKSTRSEMKLDYLITGSWSLKAYQEAIRLLGQDHVNVVTDSRAINNSGRFGKIAEDSDWKLSNNSAFVYYCDNETVDGVEFPQFPAALAPNKDGAGPIVVADMSSNILSRQVPIENFGVVFFGAQKNLGPPGITVVIINRDLLPPVTPQPSPALMRALGLPIAPVVLSYETTEKNNSLYNTLPIFDVYVAGQVLKRLLLTFPNRVADQEALAKQKADIIYAALEEHPDIYRIVPDKSVRSRMNICFRVTMTKDIKDSELEFLELAKDRGLIGLKGHRSVGGIRASNYNSVSLESAVELAEFLRFYAKK